VRLYYWVVQCWFLIASISSAMNLSSSLLFLIIVCHLSRTNSLIMEMLTVNRAWSNKYWNSRWMVWLSIFKEFSHRNIRLITKFASFVLSKYLVGTWLVGFDKIRSKESAMSVIRLLWKLNERSQLLSLMLKLPAMTMTLWILALVSFRYFKAIWVALE